MNFERYVQRKAGSNDIESSSKTDAVTKPPDIREILPVACRVLHSLLTFFESTIARCTSTEGLKADFIIACNELVYWFLVKCNNGYPHRFVYCYRNCKTHQFFPEKLSFFGWPQPAHSCPFIISILFTNPDDGAQPLKTLNKLTN